MADYKRKQKSDKASTKRNRSGRNENLFRSDVYAGELFRVPIAITDEMDDWLVDLSKKMKASGGYKLPRSYIVRAMLKAFMRMKNLDVSGVRDEKELESRIREAVRKS